MALKMTIKMKLLGAGVSVSLLLCVILGITVYFFQNLDQGFQEIVATSGHGVTKSQSADETIGQVNTELTKLTARMNNVSDAISKSNMFVQITAKKIKKLSNELSDITETVEETYDGLSEGDAKDSLETVADDIGDMQERMKREALIGLDRSVKDLQQFTVDIVVISNKVQQLTGELDVGKTLSNDIKKINTGIQQQSLGFKTSISKNRNILALVIVIFAVSALVISFVFARSITTPLGKAVGFAKTIADGDFSRKLEITRQDELGTLTLSLNEMATNLSVMIADINNKVASLTESSTSMTDVSHGMSASADQTVVKANTVAAAAEEMNSNMDSVAAAMEEASTNVDSVAAATDEMSTGIADIALEAGEASKNSEEAVTLTRNSSEMVTELGQAAEEIGQVIETIAAISDKTNLLALNATIEAARAGEAGKGFAVVANEIKDLASQTAKATTDIAEKLKSIQKSTSTTIQGIGNITQAIEQVNEVVGHITSAMEQQNSVTAEIAENVDQASLGLKEINENVAQTSLASAQVAQEIGEVNEEASEISNSSAMVGSAAGELRDLAGELNHQVAQFKTNR